MTVRCKSVTHAIKGKEILAINNIPASVQKELPSLASGCVYTLQFDDRYETMARDLLLQNGVALHKSEKKWLKGDLA